MRPNAKTVNLTCGTCGARCTEEKDAKRFLRRHPALCSERAAFTKQLAAGTRCVDSEQQLLDRMEEERL